MQQSSRETHVSEIFKSQISPGLPNQTFTRVITMIDLMSAIAISKLQSLLDKSISNKSSSSPANWKWIFFWKMSVWQPCFSILTHSLEYHRASILFLKNFLKFSVFKFPHEIRSKINSVLYVS
jgi:hypothetical protein